MEQNKQLTYDGGVTKEQINKWKMQHRKVARVDVVDGEECHIGYFKRPSMETIAAMSKVSKTDETRSAQILFDGYWLGGSEYLRQDAVLFTAAMTQLDKVFKSCMGSLKNL